MPVSYEHPPQTEAAFPTDTLTRAKSTLNRQLGMNATAIKSVVAQQLIGKVSIASTSDFLQTTLRLPPKADKSFRDIYRRVKQEFWTGGKSHRGGRWKNFPPKDKANLCESDYYESFVDLANGVSRHCKALKLMDDESVEGFWVSRPHQAPTTRDVDHPTIKPDIVHVTRPQTFRTLDQQLSDVEGQDHSGKAGVRKRNMNRVWWLQVHTVVEVKVAEKPRLEDLNSAIIQLCSYMRQMSGEQLDRRFVIGMLLCGDDLTLWLCDRSGLVGTLKPIPIHQDPETFIKVLVAFATLPAKKLGWDPTMRIYQSGRNQKPIPSYKMAPSHKDFQTDSYQVNWVISMPRKDDPSQRKDFVTLRAAIAASTYDLCTRGTIVWQVVKLEDFKKKSNQKIFVLKQIWRPLRANELDNGKWTGGPDQKPFEAEMYDAAGMADRVYSSEDLDEEGCTLNIRDGLNAKPLHEATEWNETLQALMLRSHRAQERPESQEPFTYLNCTKPPGYGVFNHVDDLDDQDPLYRTQARILLERWGFPLKYFLDLRELLGAIRGAVKDHEKMYFAGVLHRDVSIGNILITPTIPADNLNHGTEWQDCGQLIDLDHAKRAITLSPCVKHDPPSGDALNELHNRLRRSIDRSVVKHACVRYGDRYRALEKYLEGLYDFEYGENGVETLTMKQLGWTSHDEWRHKPQFSDEKSKNPPRTGTIQFMSAEVMVSKNLAEAFWTENFTHDAIHDMESFFWVLVYICLTRDGPGGKQRPELTPPKLGARSTLYNTLQKVFENANQAELGNRRQDLVKDLVLFKQDILNHFRPYFRRLEPMIEKWHILLQRARNFHSIEYDQIHVHVTEILSEALANLQPDDPSYADGTTMASQAREKWWHESSMPHLDLSRRESPPTGMKSPVTPTPTAGPSRTGANFVMNTSPLSPSHTLNSQTIPSQNMPPCSPLHRTAYMETRASKRKLRLESSPIQTNENLAPPKKRPRLTKPQTDADSTSAEVLNKNWHSTTSSNGDVGPPTRTTRSSARIARRNTDGASSRVVARKPTGRRKKMR